MPAKITVQLLSPNGHMTQYNDVQQLHMQGVWLKFVDSRGRAISTTMPYKVIYEPIETASPEPLQPPA